MACDGAGHELLVDFVSEQFETRHVGAGPTDAGERAQCQGRPEAICETCESEVRQYGQRHAQQIDAFGIDPVGK